MIKLFDLSYSFRCNQSLMQAGTIFFINFFGVTFVRRQIGKDKSALIYVTIFHVAHNEPKQVEPGSSGVVQWASFDTCKEKAKIFLLRLSFIEYLSILCRGTRFKFSWASMFSFLCKCKKRPIIQPHWSLVQLSSFHSGQHEKWLHR